MAQKNESLLNFIRQTIKLLYRDIDIKDADRHCIVELPKDMMLQLQQQLTQEDATDEQVVIKIFNSLTGNAEFAGFTNETGRIDVIHSDKFAIWPLNGIELPKVTEIISVERATDVPNLSTEPGEPTYIKVRFDGNPPAKNTSIVIEGKETKYGYIVTGYKEGVTTLLVRSTAIGELAVGDTMKVTGLLPGYGTQNSFYILN